MNGRNRYLEAFKENYNVIGLTSVLALSAAMLSPLPLLVGLVAEAAYLVFVPDSRWYDVRLSHRYDADVRKRREQLKQQILPTLRPVVQARYMRLEEMRQQIEKQAADDQTWVREVLRKLDYLLEKFLQFASKEVQFRNYLDSVLEQERNSGRRSGRAADDAPPPRAAPPARRTRGSAARPPATTVGPLSFDNWQPQSVSAGPVKSNLAPDAAGTNHSAPSNNSEERWIQQTVSQVQASYDAELEEIKGEVANEQDESTKAVLEKRFDVLQRRREFVGKMGKILSNLNHQLELLEDTFGLISDEICARSPEQVLADIEDVVSQTNTMTQLLDEVAPFEQSMAHMSLQT